MNASVVSSTGSLPLAVVAVGILAAGGIAGLLASLVLLRYADKPLVGWLLGVRTTDCGEEYEQRSENRATVAPTAPSQPTVGVGSVKAGDTATAPEPLDHLAADFAVHAQAVRAQVSRYADLLADGDAVLRARLRRLEDGGLSSSHGHTSGGAR